MNTPGCVIKGPKRMISGVAAQENEHPWLCSILNKDLSVRLKQDEENNFNSDYNFSFMAAVQLY